MKPPYIVKAQSVKPGTSEYNRPEFYLRNYSEVWAEALSLG